MVVEINFKNENILKSIEPGEVFFVYVNDGSFEVIHRSDKYTVEHAYSDVEAIKIVGD